MPTTEEDTKDQQAPAPEASGSEPEPTAEKPATTDGSGKPGSEQPGSVDHGTGTHFFSPQVGSLKADNREDANKEAEKLSKKGGKS